ncbi:MAG: hypothetical protein ACO295_00500 [Sediminibacterium sp.]
MKVKIDGRKMQKVLNNLVDYNAGYIKEIKMSKQKIEKVMAITSINAFYQYLDGLARLHPGMLHHVYEWGEIGNPSQRLFDLDIRSTRGGATSVFAEFLQSNTVPENGTEPFYNKAQIMEDGIPVVIKEKNAQALFFESEGQEFFRLGPIVIENPGGSEVRGSFVRAFEEFYNVYFTQVYLRAIKFYKHFEKSDAYRRNIKAASKSGNAYKMGQAAVLEMIMRSPGDESIDS